MLEPDDRRLLLAALAPPDGCQLDWAVGTTYSLDLMALLTAPVAFAFSECHTSEGRPVLDPLALLQATRKYADRMLLFCQAGRIHVPSNYRQLLARLEGSVAEAIAPLEGSFHPKVWFLRFLDDQGQIRYRFLCLSRNMTFDRSWDTILNVEGPLADRQRNFACNHPLGQFVEALPGMVHRELPQIWRERLTLLASEIRRTDFEVPEPFDEMTFAPLGLRRGTQIPFSDRIDRLLVISPFLDKSFIDQIQTWQAPMQLVSRLDTLTCLTAADLGPFEKVWVLDPSAEPEAGDEEAENVPGPGQPELGGNATPDSGTKGVGESEVDHPPRPSVIGGEELPLLGLHAKVYVADDGWNSSIWTGSANATGAAFGKNVEFLVELRGKKSVCGTETILGRRSESRRGPATCLADLLQPFSPGDAIAQEDSERQAFERLADSVARQLARAAPVARCLATGNPDEFTLELLPSRPMDDMAIAPNRLLVRPLSWRSDRKLPVDLASKIWCRFDRVSTEGLTSFFAWELSSESGDFTHEFVLQAALLDPPAHRQEAILRSILTDREQVLRFLLMLLSDPDSMSLMDLLRQRRGSDESQSVILAVTESGLLESLLRALDRRPEQIDEIERLITDLGQTAGGRALLPPDLHKVWDAVAQVRREQTPPTMAAG